MLADETIGTTQIFFCSFRSMACLVLVGLYAYSTNLVLVGLYAYGKICFNQNIRPILYIVPTWISLVFSSLVNLNHLFLFHS
jgi:hypothetical protein